MQIASIGNGGKPITKLELEFHDTGQPGHGRRMVRKENIDCGIYNGRGDNLSLYKGSCNKWKYAISSQKSIYKNYSQTLKDKQNARQNSTTINHYSP